MELPLRAFVFFLLTVDLQNVIIRTEECYTDRPKSPAENFRLNFCARNFRFNMLKNIAQVEKG